jgi:hypothetical protein
LIVAPNGGVAGVDPEHHAAPDDKTGHERKCQNLQEAWLHRLGSDKRGFDHAKIGLRNAPGNVGLLHPCQNGIVKSSVSHNFSNKGIVGDRDLVEFQRRSFLFLERGGKPGFGAFGGLV